MIESPRALQTSDMKEKVIVILDNEMVDTMLEIDKDIYGIYVILGKNEKKTCTLASAR